MAIFKKPWAWMEWSSLYISEQAQNGYATILLCSQYLSAFVLQWLVRIIEQELIPLVDVCFKVFVMQVVQAGAVVLNVLPRQIVGV